MKKVRELNGYRLIYKPDHFSCMTSNNWKGYVYEHKYIMELYLNRALTKEEIVHHLDCNKRNNRIDNLLLLTRNMHAKLHFWINSGAFVHESYDRNGMNSEKSKVIEPIYCKICGKTLQKKQKVTCSFSCRGILKTSSYKPSKEQLKQDMLTLSWVAIGKKYKVSDNGARKWAKQYKLL